MNWFPFKYANHCIIVRIYHVDYKEYMKDLLMTSCVEKENQNITWKRLSASLQFNKIWLVFWCVSKRSSWWLKMQRSSWPPRIRMLSAWLPLCHHVFCVRAMRTCHNVPKPGWDQTNAARISLMPAWFWHIMACFQIEWKRMWGILSYIGTVIIGIRYRCRSKSTTEKCHAGNWI